MNDNDILIAAFGTEIERIWVDGICQPFGPRLRETISGATFVKIPSGVHEIARHTFYEMTQLESVDISEGVETIGEKAFYFCIRLKTIRLPSTVKMIESAAFQECSGLETVVVDSPDATICVDAFKDCNAIRRVSLNNSVTIKLADGSLKHFLDMHEGLPVWKHVFPSCPSLGIRMKDRYAAGFVDRATAITTLAALGGLGRRDERSSTQRLPPELVDIITYH